MVKKALFVHGFNSGSDSSTGAQVKKYLEEGYYRKEKYSVDVFDFDIDYYQNEQKEEIIEHERSSIESKKLEIQTKIEFKTWSVESQIERMQNDLQSQQNAQNGFMNFGLNNINQVGGQNETNFMKNNNNFQMGILFLFLLELCLIEIAQYVYRNNKRFFLF